MPTTRPFPGITFQVETPIRVDLPRMDIAGFVGFAQRGPVHIPVVVESYVDFVNFFGSIYQLAWDREENLWQTACLATAVKAFFTQGGRRCWVVRVAAPTATTTTFPLSGLLQTDAISGYSGVSAIASSPGSWADNLQTRVELLSDSLGFMPTIVAEREPLQLSLKGLSDITLQSGDLLQLDFGDRRHRAYVVVPPREQAVNFNDLEFAPSQIHWFYRLQQSLFQQSPFSLSGRVYTVKASVRDLRNTIPIILLLLRQYNCMAGILFLRKSLMENTTATLELTDELTEAQRLESDTFVSHATLTLTDPLSIEVGDWLRLEAADQTLWLQVSLISLRNLRYSNVPIIWLLLREIEYRVFIAGILFLHKFLTELTVTNLWAQGFDPTTVGSNLELERLQRLQMALQVRSLDTTADNLKLTLRNLAGAAPHPRFIGSLPTDDELFTRGLDTTQQTPNNPAAALWEEVSSPRFPLALTLAENSLVLPLGLDATLPWRGANLASELSLVRDGLVPPVSDYQNLSGVDWVDFLPTLFLDPYLRLTGQRSLLREANDRLYLQGERLTGIHGLLPIEEVSMVILPDAAHRGWRLTEVETVSPPSPPRETTPPDSCVTNSPFKNCDQLVSDPKPEQPTIDPTPATQWQLLEPNEYFSAGLLEVQQAIAKFAAARGDLVALLSAPKHYRPPELFEHQSQLLASLRQAADNTDSYVALYYPWLASREVSGALLHQHPSGAIAGIMAHQSLEQGAWLAPANTTIQGILTTSPFLTSADEQALYQAGINPIRQIPRGFVPWGNFTQSRDSDLEALNLRRLLILLRRLAIREGQTYVFVPHSAAFRRRIKQQFEQVLNRLFDQGAFAGSDRSQAYQVVIDTSLNTQSTIEKGQLIIELRVAPSRPMTFITVRLVQLDGGQFSIQEVSRNGR